MILQHGRKKKGEETLELKEAKQMHSEEEEKKSSTTREREMSE